VVSVRWNGVGPRPKGTLVVASFRQTSRSATLRVCGGPTTKGTPANSSFTPRVRASHHEKSTVFPRWVAGPTLGRNLAASGGQVVVHVEGLLPGGGWGGVRLPDSGCWALGLQSSLLDVAARPQERQKLRHIVPRTPLVHIESLHQV